jgi:hypothetical protein
MTIFWECTRQRNGSNLQEYEADTYGIAPGDEVNAPGGEVV